MEVALVDPSSYSLPYDNSYLCALSKHHQVDFFCSESINLKDYRQDIKKYANSFYVYKVSPISNNRFFGLINYLRMLASIVINYRKYKYIHFQWSIFFPFELVFFLLFRNKIIFTVHNDVPHGFKGHRKFSYYILSKLSKKNIFVSDFTLNRFEKNYFKGEKNIVVQHGLMYLNGCDLKIQDRRSRKYDLVFWGRIEDYKGLGVFLNLELQFLEVGIFGHWSKALLCMKEELATVSSFVINDQFISETLVCELVNQKNIFILPYKSATQSGILYTILAHRVVFIASNVGENASFLMNNDLKELIFDRTKPNDILRAYQYAKDNYDDLMLMLYSIDGN